MIYKIVYLALIIAIKSPPHHENGFPSGEKLEQASSYYLGVLKQCGASIVDCWQSTGANMILSCSSPDFIDCARCYMKNTLLPPDSWFSCAHISWEVISRKKWDTLNGKDITDLKLFLSTIFSQETKKLGNDDLDQKLKRLVPILKAKPGDIIHVNKDEYMVHIPLDAEFKKFLILTGLLILFDEDKEVLTEVKKHSKYKEQIIKMIDSLGKKNI